MQQDHSGAIWVLGLLLVIAAAVTSPFWKDVGFAAATGALRTSSGPQPVVPATAGEWTAAGNVFAPGSGLMVTVGALVLVLIFVAMAKASESLGALALVLLLALWVLFLLGHTTGFANFFGRFMPAQS